MTEQQQETFSNTGTIIKIELGAKGKISKGKRIGQPWQIYKYCIETDQGQEWLSCFKRFVFNLGDKVSYTYTESPNPNNENYPYKNLRSMSQATDEDDSGYDTESPESTVLNQQSTLVPQNPVRKGSNLIQKRQEKFLMSPKEIDIWNLILNSLSPGDQVSSEDFMVTFVESINVTSERAKQLWLHYLDVKDKQ